MISSPKVPFMQLPTISFLLAIASGMLDGYAFFTTKSFATFQSGNIIMLGYEFAKHGLTAVMPYIISIISFGAGAMLLAWIRYRYNTDEKTWTFTLLSLEIVLLLLLIIYIFYLTYSQMGFMLFGLFLLLRECKVMRFIRLMACYMAILRLL